MIQAPGDQLGKHCGNLYQNKRLPLQPFCTSAEDTPFVYYNHPIFNSIEAIHTKE